MHAGSHAQFFLRVLSKTEQSSVTILFAGIFVYVVGNFRKFLIFRFVLNLVPLYCLYGVKFLLSTNIDSKISAFEVFKM